jgi:hypothetical protein
VLALGCLAPGVLRADTGAAATQAPAPPDDDLDLDKVHPDFTVIDLPTTLRLPRHRLAFRVTHRFTRPLGAGDFGDLAGDLFALDSGAQIGLELRFGLFRGTQVGLNRTSDRTLQLFLHQQVVRESRAGFGAAVFASVDGLDNFSDERTPAVGVVFSRSVGSHAALYAVPFMTTNVHAGHGEPQASRTLLGLSARVRLGDSNALVAEYSPRIAGQVYGARESALLAFGLEKRVGGHAFQLNVSNGLGTTLGQVAHGGFGYSDWFLGFNVSRKFF